MQLSQRVQHADIRVVVGVAVVLTLMVGVILSGGGDAIERHVVGRWSCAVAVTDVDRGSGYDPDGIVPAPFDRLVEDDVGLYDMSLRPPRSGEQLPTIQADVTVHGDGRFSVSGWRIGRESRHRGSWSVEDGLVVARFDVGLVLAAEPGTGEVTGMLWDGHTPEVYGMDVLRGEDSVAVRSTSDVAGYQTTCTRLSRDPGPPHDPF